MTRFSPILILVLTLSILGAEGCAPDAERQSEGSKQATQDVQQSANEMYSRFGTPQIDNYQEYQFAKLIMEMRDERVATWTYTVDERGRKHFVCRSVGYGLPYSTQVTPSKQPYDGHQSVTALPLREPNGLYMPQNVSATWILCKDDDAEMGVSPYYSEPELLVTTDSLDDAVY